MGAQSTLAPQRPGSWVTSSWEHISQFSIGETIGSAWLPQCKCWAASGITQAHSKDTLTQRKVPPRDAGAQGLGLCKPCPQQRIKDFISMELIRMAASLWVRKVHHNRAGSRIKSESQTRGAQLQLASRKGRLIGRIQVSGTQEWEQIQISQWLDPISQKPSVHSFLTLSLLSSLILLAWQLFSLRFLHLVREFQAACLMPLSL